MFSYSCIDSNVSRLSFRMLRANRAANRALALPRRVARALCSGKDGSAKGGFGSEFAAVHKSTITAQLWGERQALKDKTVISSGSYRQWLEEVPDHLVIKRPDESASSAVYAFDRDRQLRDQYINAFGGIRFGVLFEDMDALAGNIAFKHADDNNPKTRPLLLVTASVDQINLLRSVPMDHALRLAGRVAWVGRSSMQIRIALTDQGVGEAAAEADAPAGPELLAANFTFVARDQKTGKAAAINQLEPGTDAEHSLFESIDAAVAAAKAAREEASQPLEQLSARERLEKQERALLREAAPLLSMPSLAPSDAMLIRSTRVSNALLTNPQQRNTAGRIFGGFLMRRAFELGHACAYLFAGARPKFRQVEHVSFRAPVEVGALLKLNAAVLLSQPDAPQPTVTVDVEATIVNVEKRSSVTSNTFTFTFSCERDELRAAAASASKGRDGEAGDGALKRVLPADSEEARRQLEVRELLTDASL